MTITSSAIENGPDPGFIVSAKPSFWVTAINVFALKYSYYENKVF